ncbi:Guanine nucleotide-binding protein alpha-1 subunit-like protein [Drosera capensis]
MTENPIMSCIKEDTGKLWFVLWAAGPMAWYIGIMAAMTNPNLQLVTPIYLAFGVIMCCLLKGLLHFGILTCDDSAWKLPHTVAAAQLAGFLCCARFKSWDYFAVENNITTKKMGKKIFRKACLLHPFENFGKHAPVTEVVMVIKLLFQTGFQETELKSYVPVIHSNVFQTIKLLHDASNEMVQNEAEPSQYALSAECKEIGNKLSEIGTKFEYPHLTEDLALEIETLWKDPAIQEAYARGNELQLPDCALYFMENLQRLANTDYVPTKDERLTSRSRNMQEDVLYARVQTTGVVEIQFSPVGENKRSGEVYRICDVGGQKNERRKWIHLFEGVTAVIFCAAISELGVGFMNTIIKH